MLPRTRENPIVPGPRRWHTVRREATLILFVLGVLTAGSIAYWALRPRRVTAMEMKVTVHQPPKPPPLP